MDIRGKTMTQYMSRRKFYIPKNEIERYYGKEGDLSPSDMLFSCDYEEDDANQSEDFENE